MRALRIAAVTSSFPRDEGDYAGRFVHDLHTELVALGHEVTTFCPAARNAASEEKGSAGLVRRLGARSRHDEGVFYGSGLEANLGRRPLALRCVLDFVRRARRALLDLEPRPELLVAHWLVPSGWAVGAARRRLAVRALGVVHGGDAFVLARPALGRLAALPLRGGFDGLLCTSTTGEALVRRRFALPTLVAPMGAPPHGPAERLPLQELPPRYVLGVGRLVPVKGFDVLVRASTALPLPVVIIGDGPERRTLEKLATSLAAPVAFLGTCAHRTALRAIANAAVVAVPSRVLPSGRTEGTPRVAIEAAVAGTAVVATAVGGLKDSWPSAALVPPEDPHALARALVLASARSETWPRPDRTRMEIRHTAEALLALC